MKNHVLFSLTCSPPQAYHSPVASLLPSCRLPVAFLSQENTLPLSCRSLVAFPCRFPVAFLSPLALSPSCRLPLAFLLLILSLCLVSCCFPVVSLSPPCRRPVASLLPSCRTSPVTFLLPAWRFLSPPCCFPVAFLLFSCRHPVVFLLPPCRLPVAPRRILPLPASRGPNLVQKIGGPFTFGGGGLSHVLQLPPPALSRVRLALRPPPSRGPLSRGLPSQMFAQ